MVLVRVFSNPHSFTYSLTKSTLSGPMARIVPSENMICAEDSALVARVSPCQTGSLAPSGRDCPSREARTSPLASWTFPAGFAWSAAWSGAGKTCTTTQRDPEQERFHEVILHGRGIVLRNILSTYKFLAGSQQEGEAEHAASMFIDAWH
jgi:hypothetical protein